jgi:putative molybdopterin biosynthesis protein
LTKIYVDAMPLQEAWSRFVSLVELSPLGPETIAALESCGRVTAEVVPAEISSPHYHASAMDGYALRAETTFGATERRPVRLQVAAAGPLIPEAMAIRVDTGDPLPEGCDAVALLENAILVRTETADGRGPSQDEPGAAGPVTIELSAAVYPWQSVRVQGEDIVAGQVLFGQNHCLSPADVGLLLSAGVFAVRVWRRPVVTFIPTGDEVVSPVAGLSLRPGDIIETNGTVARLTLESWGAVVHLTGPVGDDPALIGRALDDALQVSDLVLIGAGASAGRGDFTARIIADRGEVAVHGIAIRPGKPVVLGKARGRPVIGLPGYPVSSALALELFVRPLLAAWQGQPPPQAERLEARLGRPIPSPLGVDEFVRVKVARLSPTGDPGPTTPYVAVPLPRGAGLLSSLSQADGVVSVPAAREGISAGEVVSVALTRHRSAIDRALLVTGSHDLLLDLLASRLAARDPSLLLSIGRTGSAGGLLALRDGLCHLAGTHLLDETTGDYNRPWVTRLLPGRRVRLLTLAWRRQGLIIRPGNPKGIRGLGSLFAPGVVFINRQRGSGTRVLLDYLLERALRDPSGPHGSDPSDQSGFDPSDISGYEREEGSHLGVASAVASGAADTGLGILAAARALGLDFIPVAEERYDLAYPAELEDDARLRLLVDIVRSDEEFRAAARKLGGYDLRDTGKEAGP